MKHQKRFVVFISIIIFLFIFPVVNAFLIGGKQGSGYHNGSIDEVSVYNRSFSASEVKDHYELGDSYIVWNAWQSEGLMEDWVGKISTGMGKFIQFKAVFNTNDTDKSSYLLNYTLLGTGKGFAVTLILPENNNNSIKYNNTLFNCSATTSNNDLVNMTLYSNYLGTWQSIETKDLTGSSNSTTFTRNIYSDLGNNSFIDKAFDWNCLAYDEVSNNAWADSNFTFSSWDLGSYFNTTNSTTGKNISLTSGSSSGNYTSQIFDSGSQVNWSNLVWSATQTNLSHTKLLLHLDGSDGDQSTTDSSNQAHAITFNADAHLNTSEKEFGTSSLKLDGTGDYLNLSDDNDWNYGSGDFTIDTWIYKDSGGGFGTEHLVAQQDAARNGCVFYITSTNQIAAAIGNGEGAWPILFDSGANTFNNDTWTHIALVRTGNDFVLYINGTNVGSDTNAYTISDKSNNLLIGKAYIAGFDFEGFLDELRVSKGIARWTANFTPDTSPYDLTEDETTLIMSTRESDDGSNWDSWTDYTNNSGQINSSARYLQYRANLSTTDTNYTPYLNWVNISYEGAFAVTLILPENNNNSIKYNNTLFNCSATTSNNDLVNMTLYSNYLGTWQSIETKDLTGSSNSTTFTRNIYSDLGNNSFIDKAFDWNCLAYDEASNNAWADSNFTFSSWDLGSYYQTTNSTTGKNINLTSGSSSGNYTSQIFDAGRNFNWSNLVWSSTLPRGDDIDSDTKLLLHLDGPDDSTTDADFIDSSGQGHTVNQEGDAKLENTEKKFGVTSGYFDGDGDYLNISDSNNWDFGSGNFTIDLWMNSTNINTNQFIVAHVRDCTGANTFTGWYLAIMSGHLYFVDYNNNNPIKNLTDSVSWSNNTLYHVAVVMESGNLTFYRDGESIASSDSWAALHDCASTVLRVGDSGQGGGTAYLIGYIDEFRISKGIARWTSNFTPPIMAYNDSTNITISTRESDDGSNWDAWTDYTNNSGQINSSARYLQYRANLSTPDTDYTPSLNWVNISYEDAFVVTLILPENNNNSIKYNNTLFNCSATTLNNDLVNMTLYSNYLGTWQSIETKDLTGSSNSTTFTRNILEERGINGTGFRDEGFEWNCLVYDETSNSVWADSNFTFSSWDFGSYFNTTNSTTGEYVSLTSGSSSGNYTSQIFDASSQFNWSNLVWSSTLPSGEDIDGNTKLLLHLDGPDDSTADADFIDSSGQGHTVNQEGDAKLENTEKKFGVTSGYFDGDGDYLNISDSDDWDFGSGDFTIDLWMNSTNITLGLLVAHVRDCTGVNTFTGWYLAIAYEHLYFVDYDNNLMIKNLTDSVSWSNNTWYHVAVVMESGNLTFYQDGKSIASSDSWAALHDCASTVLRVGDGGYGAHGSGTVFFTGYIDDLRISKGIARWTSNFIPPMAYNDSTNLTMLTRESDDGSNWDAWTDYTNNSGQINSSARYLQYRANLSTPDTDYTPYLNWVNVSYTTSEQAPNTPSLSLVSVDGTNQSNSDLNCSATISDSEGDDMNVTIKWHKNAVLNLTINYNNSYSNATLFSAILDSGNTSKLENWSCSLRLYDGASYSGWGNSTNLTILNTLPNVTLLSPENNNVTTNRTPEFSWNGSDIDNDDLTYDLNISCYHSLGGGGDDNRSFANLSGTSKVLVNYLKYLSDNNYYYNWTVRASDDNGMTYGAWTSYWKIQIQSLVDIILTNNSVSFGLLGVDQTNDTTDDNPLPFLLQNDGNCMLNTSINATDLWGSILGNSSYFQYKIDNKTGEEGSFDWSKTKTSWQQMPNVTEMAIVSFNWSDLADSAEIDLNVTAPPDEGAGYKTSTIYFTANLGE